ncbi:MAG: Phosphoserine phosphatase RsbP [Pseudomonadota bacterium]
MLSAFGALRSIHTYFGFVGESAPLSLVRNMVNYSCLGASFVFLLMFLEKLMGARMIATRVWHRAVAVLLFSSIFTAGHWLVPNYQVNSTLIADTLSSAFGIGLVVAVIVGRKFRKNSQGKLRESENQTASLFTKTMAQVQIALALATLAMHGSVNADELLNSIAGAVSLTDPLDWRHMMLMPALLTAGLLEVGSVAKRMQTFGQEMAHKALIEKELKVGHDVQARMLPEKKFKTTHWQWRATYHPAEALAGDWFDIREIEFAEGKKMLAVCLADVTGHGVGSSLSTSVICSHWSLWCQRLAVEPYPADKKRREELLASAPLCIHKGLSALRKNENCTAMMALLDPQSNEVTITSAGHPGGLILNKKGLRYVTTAGERLGGELMGDPIWTSKTEVIGPEDLLVIYSDGIVPVGVTILSWAGQLKKRILAGEHSFEMMLMKTLHNNKRAFMQDPSNEDDMTLLLLKRNESAETV